MKFCDEDFLVSCTGKCMQRCHSYHHTCFFLDGFQVFDMNPVAVAEYLCGSEPGTEWYFGDFNSDTRADLLCSSKNKLLYVSLLFLPLYM